MRRTIATITLLILIFLTIGPVAAKTEVKDKALRQSMAELSASIAVGGAGWEAYANLLHADYARWAMGEVYEGREKFVNSLKEWWDYGMRVESRDVEIVGVDIIGDIAIVRFVTTETFIGPDGESVGFSGHVSNTWIKEHGDWKLLSADISSITAP